MKIFISGATGFVGGHLAENLINEGHEIRTLARQSSDVSFIKSLGVEIVYGDLVHYPSVKNAVEGCELIYHTARARPEITRKKSVYYDINVRGTDNIMRAAIESGTRHVVHCSSTKVYGQPKKIPVNESSPTNPISFHDITKLESEKVVLEYAKKRGLSTLIARLTSIIGPGDFRWLSLFRRIINKKFIMVGTGNVHFHLTYINDIVDGLKLCAGNHNSIGECYILGGEEIPTLDQFVAIIAEEAGVELPQKKLPLSPFSLISNLSRPIFSILGIEHSLIRRVDFFSRQCSYDISKAKRELGYSPRVSLREGVKQTLNWFRERQYL